MNSLHLLSPSLSTLEAVPTRSRAEPQGHALPAHLADVYARHLAALNTKVAAGDIFDGPVTVLRKWACTSNQLHLEVQSSSYVPMTAMRLTYVEALRDGLLLEADIPSIPSKFGACLCACVVVLTADNQIISLRRAANLSNPGTVSLGMGEVLEPSDFEPAPLSLHRAGARALREELGVTLTPGQTARFVRPMYLARGQECGTWVFILVVDLRRAGPDFTAARILVQAQSAPDAWESSLRQSVAFNPDSLDTFIRENTGRLGLWANQLVEMLLAELYVNGVDLGT